jgi:hypothetical protein
VVGCALYRVSGACFTRMARGSLGAGVRLGILRYGKRLVVVVAVNVR